MDFHKRAKELVAQMTYAEKMAQMLYDAPAIPRLGIPAYNWWNECLHGVGRSGYATVFPVAIGMAASFNTEKMFEVATAISDEGRAKYNEYKKAGETKAYQGITFWSPNINIFRDPRWGRGHETYGEDPYLTGEMAVAFVKGIQGNGKYRKADATLKHFVAHSGPEAERHSFNAIVSEKDLHETYLWAFKYCIEHADPSAVMGAYTCTNGEPTCASETYVKGKLFGEIGFKGYFVSDCGAICDINLGHHITENEAESAALAVNNGCHLNCGDAYKWLKTAAALDLITEETVTEAVEKLFATRFRLGMFDNDCEYDNIPISVVECEEHTLLNRQMAQESIVLLKNDGILPLCPLKNIAVLGPNADDLSVLLGNYNGIPSVYATPLNGIRSQAQGIVEYVPGCAIADTLSNEESEALIKQAVDAAAKADVVIMCMGLNPLMEGEQGDAFNSDMSGDKIDLELPNSQKRLFESILDLGKDIIFVNMSGSCMNLVRQDETCNAVLQCFYPGAQGGNALADVIFGKASPSGRLPVTFYRSADDLPPFADYSMENRTYKFFTGTPLYPFGHGLTYGEITENWIDEYTVELSNTGKHDTLYSVLRYEYIPHKNLCGFRKILIRRGERLIISFE